MREPRVYIDISVFLQSNHLPVHNHHPNLQTALANTILHLATLSQQDNRFSSANHRTHPSKMSLFPRSLYNADPSFTPLFRLLDEFDTYSRETGGGNSERPHQRGRQNANTLSPRFDMRETDNAYELHGELPGIERDKVNIEFTDPHTLVIHGRTERTYTTGTPNSGLIEDGTQKEPGTTTEEDEEHSATTKKSGGSGAESDGKEKTKAPFEKYWVQERSVGEFSRTFSFPSRVDQDAVSASLNNGVLSLSVPKAKKHETRRIAIN